MCSFKYCICVLVKLPARTLVFHFSFHPWDLTLSLSRITVSHTWALPPSLTSFTPSWVMVVVGALAVAPHSHRFVPLCCVKLWFAAPHTMLFFFFKTDFYFIFLTKPRLTSLFTRYLWLWLLLLPHSFSAHFFFFEFNFWCLNFYLSFDYVTDLCYFRLLKIVVNHGKYCEPQRW